MRLKLRDKDGEVQLTVMKLLLQVPLDILLGVFGEADWVALLLLGGERVLGRAAGPADKEMTEDLKTDFKQFVKQFVWHENSRQVAMRVLNQRHVQSGLCERMHFIN